MRIKKENKRRLCIIVSDILDNRLEHISIEFGVSKSDLVRIALMEYFYKIDNSVNVTSA